MPLDLTSLAPNARTAYIRIGRQFGSSSTLAQANQTLKGLAAHGSELAQHGFPARDGQRLLDARDSLATAGVDRVEARGDKKVTGKTYVSIFRTGKAARQNARSILQSARSALHEIDTPVAEAGVTRIDTVLQQTRSADE